MSFERLRLGTYIRRGFGFPTHGNSVPYAVHFVGKCEGQATGHCELQSAQTTHLNYGEADENAIRSSFASPDQSGHLMTRKSFISLLAFFLLACQLQGKEKNRDWQAGTLTRVESNDEGTAALPVAGAVVVLPIHEWTYLVETDSMVYAFGRKSPRSLNVTVNGRVKFAIDKNARAYLIDDDGKEFQVSVIRKIAKNPVK